jgi:hypothetical protein
MTQKKRKLFDHRPELINRYVRITVGRWTRQRAFAFARFISRPRLRWSERTRQKALIVTLETLAVEAARAKRLKFEANSTVLNIGLFFLIAERDIQAVKIDALTHPDPWARGLASRLMLLTLHELDIDKVAGNKLRQALDDGAVPQELRDEVTDAMRSIRKAQAQAQRQFANLRNSTIAHRDPDALKQYRDIVALDGLEITRIVADFYTGTSKFIAMIPRLLRHLGTWHGLLAQMQAQQDRRQAGSASSMT